MPFRDREKQLEYLRDYSRRYAEENRKRIKARRAKWFQEKRKPTAAILQRVRRTLARCESGFQALRGQERTLARAAVQAIAAAPDMPRGAQAGLWAGVSMAGRLRFVRALDSRYERRRWADVLDLAGEV